MNYGLYLSASGMFSALHRMDTAANNLANVETVGFKPDLATTMARDAVRQEDRVWNLPSDAMLERLGGGVLMAPTAVNFSQGALEQSASDLSIALQGDGFFRVRGADGQPRLTRDGRLAIDSQGVILQAGTGLPMLDESGSPIRINPGIPGPLEIGADGTVRQDQAVAGRLAVVAPKDPRSLRKEGNALFALPSGAEPGPADATVVQHALERSGADAVAALLEISDAERSVTFNSKMITSYDDLMSRAVSTFGRLG
ncbi:MAG: flagellar hook-basal body protein [Phycisphaerales bacterium]|nr:flagellar hook-basal body protein [Phycisphaerales bacterium]